MSISCYGVDVFGEEINVLDEFSIVVPYGWVYDIEKRIEKDEPAFMIGRPKRVPLNYKAGRFSMPDSTEFSELFVFKFRGELKHQNKAAINFMTEEDFKEILKNIVNDSGEVKLSINVGGKQYNCNTLKSNGLRNHGCVLKNDPFLKIGYFTMGMVGNLAYNIIIFTPRGYYQAYTMFDSNDNDKNEKLLKKIFSNTKALAEKSEERTVNITLTVESENSQAKNKGGSKGITEKPQKIKSKSIDEEVTDFIAQVNKSAEEIRKEFRKANVDESERVIAYLGFNSVLEIRKDKREVCALRNKYGSRYQDLILEVDREGKEFIKNGCSSNSILAIYNLIIEMISKENAFDIDFRFFGYTYKCGYSYIEYDDNEVNKYYISEKTKSLQSWWKAKYEDTPEMRRIKEKQKLNDNLSMEKTSLATIKSELKNLGSKESTLKKEIAETQTQIENAKKNQKTYEEKIKADSVAEIQRVEKKLENKKSEKVSTEKSLKELQTQREGLSFFKFSLKKELAKKIEEHNQKLQKITEKITDNEDKIKELEDKCAKDIAKLQRNIDDLKEKLSLKKLELSEVTKDKSKAEERLNETQKNIEAIEAKLAEY